MSLGFGHLIGAWIPAKMVEKVKKIEFSKWIWFWLLFGALLPDGDFFLEWLHLTEVAHRGFTHSLAALPLLWLVVFAVSSLAKSYLPKKEKPWMWATAVTLGVVTHIVADSVFYPGVNLLWPFDWWFAGGTFYFATASIYERIGGTLQTLNKTNLFILDMGMGAAWILYFTLKGRLKP